MTHSWPGNVRELAHAIERAALLCASDRISPEDLALVTAGEAESAHLSAVMSLADAERVVIRNALDRFGGNVLEAANALGLSRSAMYRRLEKFGIHPSDD